MGIMQKWFGTDYNPETGHTSGAGVSSPFIPATSHLAVVTAPGTPDGAVSVAKAMAVPPVARAIALYSTVISTFDLVADLPAATPTWCHQTRGAVTAGHRWALMLQDIAFTNGCVMWKDDIDADNRPVTGLSHVPRHRWNLDSKGYVEIDGVRQNTDHLVFIPGIMPQGFLDYGKSSVNHYHQINTAILNRASNPVPLLDLHISDAQFQPQESYVNNAGETVEGEVQEIARKWAAARQSTNGAVAVSPHWLEVKPLGDGKMDMLVEARNAVRLDVANFLNINAAMLDGNNGTSDTYSNTLQNTNELLTLSMRMFLEPIERRLSQDDVTDPGVRLRFDTSAFDTTDAKGNAGTAVAPVQKDASDV